MSDGWVRRSMWWGAGLAALLGFVSLGWALREGVDLSDRMARRASDVRRLEAVRRQMAGLTAEVRALEAMAAGSDAGRGPAVLVKSVFRDQQAEVQEKTAVRAGDEWELRRMEVRLRDVDLEDMGTFLEQAESMRPPWRLVECRVQATGVGTGRGHATLIVESVARVDDARSGG